MAVETIKGLTIKIGAETTGLSKALSDVNKQSKDITSELSKVNKLLKFNPKDTTILQQKQKLLGDEIAATREKLQKLKEAQSQIDEQYKNGEIDDGQYRAFQRELVETESKLKHYKKELQDTQNWGKRLGDELKKTGDKISGIGKSWTKGISAPIGAIGAASAAAWKEVDDGLDTIVTKTGATGDAMDSLGKSFNNVYGSMPVDAQSAGDAIGELNTQFGLTGKALEDASSQMLKFANINSTDVTASTQQAKGAIEAFGLSTKDLGSVLDAITATSQKTGVGVDDLFASVTKGAPTLKSLGLNFAESTQLMGRFEQSGIDSDKALSYLSKSAVVFAKNGKTMGQGLTEVAKRIKDSKSETEALTIATKYFGSKGAVFMVDAIKKGTLNLDDLSSSAKNAAGTVSKTFEGTLDPVDNFKTAMNNLKLVGSDLAGEVQTALAPTIKKLTEHIQGLTEWFANLSPAEKDTIIKIAGIAAAIGPLLIILGKLVSAVGVISTLFGSASAAIGIGGAAAAGAAPALAGLGTAILGVLGTLAPWIAGVGMAIGVGKILVDHFRKSAIPAVQLYGKETSANTKKALDGYFKLDDGAKKSLMDLEFSGKTISKSTADNLSKTFNDMGTQIKQGMDKHFNDSYAKAQEFFSKNSTLTVSEEAKALANMQKNNTDQKASVDTGTKQIQSILEKASKEKRGLKYEEQVEINNIQDKMKEKAVTSLSETELESKAILERMRQQAGNITAQQAADVVKNSLAQKNKAVANANQQYDETVQEIIKMRDETHSITADQANKLIADAKKQRDESVKQATDMHSKVVAQATKQAGEHAKQVDWETGQVKNKWQVFKDNISSTVNEIGVDFQKGWTKTKTDTANSWGQMKQNASNAWDSIWDKTKSTWNNIKAWPGQKLEETKTAARGKLADIKSYFDR